MVFVSPIIKFYNASYTMIQKKFSVFVCKKIIIIKNLKKKKKKNLSYSEGPPLCPSTLQQGSLEAYPTPSENFWNLEAKRLSMRPFSGQ